MDDSVLGHRKRLKERYLQRRDDMVHDYELLELLLTYSIPRKDVKPIAKALLKSFGNLENVLSAAPEQLKAVDGIGDSSALLICLASDIGKRAVKERVRNIRVLNCAEDAKEYFKNLLFGENNEKLVVVNVNNSNNIINYRIVQEGTVNFIDITPRKVVEAVIRDNAAKVFIAHNHPHGICRPSSADIDFTLRLREVLRPLGVEFCDHIIVGEEDVFSMASSPETSKYFKR